jgi:hypothetical protein
MTFQETFHAWRNAPMPCGSAADELDELHADLVLYDTWVAGSVLPFQDRGIWQPAVPDVLAALEDLIREVEGLQSAGTRDLESASAYLAFANLLHSLYQAFLREEGPK